MDQKLAGEHECYISITRGFDGCARLQRPTNLPSNIRSLIATFRKELVNTLAQNLVGIYLFGSIAFPGFEARSGDIDFYVILGRPLTLTETKALDAMHHTLSSTFRFGKNLDGFYITLSKATTKSTPTRLVFAADGRIHKEGVDDAWALHRQHLHKGACIVLYGPEPRTIVPPPTWKEIVRALHGEIRFAKKIIHKYPSWAVLNLCRLIYSFEKKEVAVSKIQAAQWAVRELPNQWRALIQSAVRVYLERQRRGDQERVKKNGFDFLKFASERIAKTKL
jgi:hypothetical protein